MIMSLERSKVNFILFRKYGIHIQPFKIERNSWIISILGSKSTILIKKWTFHLQFWPLKVKSRSEKVIWNLCSTTKTETKIAMKTISCAISIVLLPSERISTENFEISSQNFRAKIFAPAIQWIGRDDILNLDDCLSDFLDLSQNFWIFKNFENC